MNCFFEVTRDEQRGQPQYTVLLGANGRGRQYAADIRKTAGIKIVTKPADGMSERHVFADDTRDLACIGRNERTVKMRPIFIKETKDD
ncbi:hypothetical protein FACS1894219_10690 [Clostridia bacterium]|nr:hypothetical protein FACS1894219_10690 [Clostridia bacterium]